MFFFLLAKILALPAVTNFLIRRSMLRPYFSIVDPASGDLYMNRFWLFNPYPWGSQDQPADTRNWLLRHLPSIRIHHILRPDSDRHLHDHPWNARTFLLRGSYLEERLADESLYDCKSFLKVLHPDEADPHKTFLREAGQTFTLRYESFHRIARVSEGGVWTLFVTGPYQGPWGFLVGSDKIHWREYLSRFRNNLKSGDKKR